MAVARDGRDRWELRLGAAQAVTWIGLALGTAVGAYFVGFFSGRYVGFDTARSATVSEVARLAVQGDFFDKAVENPTTDIYSQLDGSAMDSSAPSTGESLKGGALGAVNKSGDKKPGTQEPSSATKFAQSIKDEDSAKGSLAADDKATDAKAAGVSKSSSSGSATALEIDALFEDDARPVSTAQEGKKLPEGSDAAEAEMGVLKAAQKGVRVLGDDGTPDEGENRPASEPSEAQDPSLGAILEERVAKARAAQIEAPVSNKEQSGAKSVGKAGAPDSASKGSAAATAKVVAKVEPLPKQDSANKVDSDSSSKTSTSGESPASPSSGMVKQVLPPGFFAQVAAPKRLPEAQDVARRLKRSGFPVLIETAHVRGEDYYRVLVGPEDTKLQAERLVEQLKRESYLSGTAFLRKVK